MNPFEAVYGKIKPSNLSYMPGVLKVQEVGNNLTIHGAILCTLKTNLGMDHNYMKQQADQGHSERKFVEGDQVFPCLKLYKKTSLKTYHF
jgi:hypothetical protein